MKDDASLPRHAEILVDILAVEEFMHQVRYGLFHVLLQDNVLPFRLLHLCVQVPTLLPQPAVVDIDELGILGLLPFSNGSDEGVGNAVARHDGLAFGGLFQYVLDLLVPNLHDVHDKVFRPPFVAVLRECPAFDECVWDPATSAAGVEVAVAQDRFVHDVEIGGGVTGGGELEEGHWASHQLLAL